MMQYSFALRRILRDFLYPDRLLVNLTMISDCIDNRLENSFIFLVIGGLAVMA